MSRFVLAGLVGLLAACSASAAPPAAAQVEVTIENYHFVPATLKIAAGTSISWTNKDDDVHTVMDASGAFRSDAARRRAKLHLHVREAGYVPDRLFDASTNDGDHCRAVGRPQLSSVSGTGAGRIALSEPGLCLEKPGDEVR
jgi:plastocyanin